MPIYNIANAQVAMYASKNSKKYGWLVRTHKQLSGLKSS